MSLASRIRLTLAVLLVVLLGVGGVSYWSAVRLLDAEAWVDHSQRVIERLEEAHSLLLDAETATRGYAATGADSLLGPYWYAEARLPAVLADLRSLLADNPAQGALLDLLEATLAAKAIHLQRIIDARTQGGEATAAALIAGGEGQELTDRVRRTLSTMTADENGLLRTRAVSARRNADVTLAVIATGTLFGLCIVLVGSVLAASHLASPLHRLLVGVQRLASGDLSQRLAVAGPPDVQLLAAAFNDMAAHRLAAESALRQTTVALDAIVQASPFAIVGLDAGGRVDVWNPAAERLFGWTRDEVVGLPVPSIPDEVRESFEALRLRALAGEPVAPQESRRRRKDGATIDVEVASAPRVIDGEVRGTVHLLEDIGPRKRAAAERETLVRRLETVLSSAPTGMILLDPDRRVTANPAAQRLFGHATSPRAPLAEYARQVFHPDGRPVEESELPGVRALQGNGAAGLELEIRRPDGKVVPILLGAAPLRDAAGAVQGAVVAFEDISALKEVERLREEWNAVIAHDLRQPINTIKLLTQLITRHSGDAGRVADHAGKVDQAARHLTRMVADLLDLSRLEAQNLRLACRPVDLPALARDVAAKLALEATDRPIEVAVAGTIPSLSLDPDRIEQVLTNLLSNAIKYGEPETRIHVHIALGGDGVTLAVTNRGAGIASPDLAQLFARFRRARSAEHGPVQGIGLGLYVTKGLIEAHGGRIEAESVPGETTTFRIVLPVELGDAPPPPAGRSGSERYAV